jgi:hypothetical protein
MVNQWLREFSRSRKFLEKVPRIGGARNTDSTNKLFLSVSNMSNRPVK